MYVSDAALRKAPKWLKTPVGVTFGFGGKLVSFAPKKTPPGTPATASEVFDITNISLSQSYNTPSVTLK